MIVVGAPEQPSLALCRRFGAEATVNLEEFKMPEARIKLVREIVGGYGADLAIDCSGHPSAGPKGIEMLRDGGTYVEMGQFTDAVAISTSWTASARRTSTSWAAGRSPPTTCRSASRCSIAATASRCYEMQTLFPLSEQGLGEAIAAALAMRTVKSTIMPFEGLD